MQSKLFLQIPITITILLLLLAPTLLMAETASDAKIRICHYDSPNDSEGKIITISRSALQAHLDHGDPAEYYLISKDTCKKLPKKK